MYCVTGQSGGMNSATWLVDQGDRRWVAKAVGPDEGRQLAGGLAVAQWLEQAGMAAGAAVPAAGGALAVDVGDGWLALLTWVPGQPLTGRGPAEQDLLGTTLGQVHLALAGCLVPATQRFHWVDPDAGYLSLRPWLRPAISAALAALDAAGPGPHVPGPAARRPGARCVPAGPGHRAVRGHRLELRAARAAAV